MQSKQKNNIKILLVVLASFIAPLVALAATGMGTPTIEDCVSRTGQTKAQCTEMINKFKNMSPSDAANMKPPSSATGKQLPVLKSGDATPAKPNDTTDIIQVASDINAKIERVTKMRAEKEQQFIQAESRVEKIIEFLRSKSIGTTGIESNLEIFKTKAAAVLSAFDVYAQALVNSKTDATETASEALRSAQAQIKTTMSDFVGSYGTLRNSLSVAIEKIT
ncbi:MAG: hypothetical protein NTY33_00205 [Candidatus Moranbacteria bacterium]|nr:hypothetical protein [Candidatus Moranbacteria bacterium]